jgi:hypothetical protein
VNNVIFAPANFAAKYENGAQFARSGCQQRSWIFGIRRKSAICQGQAELASVADSACSV